MCASGTDHAMVLLNTARWALNGFNQDEFCKNYARNSGDMICPCLMDKWKHVLLNLLEIILRISGTHFEMESDTGEDEIL